MAVNPDRTAVKKVAHLPAQRLDQLLRAGERKADHINHHVRLQCPDPRAELAPRFGVLPVQRHLLDGIPGAVCPVRGALAPADHNDLMTPFDQPGDQIGSHMATAADHHNSHGGCSSRQGGPSR